MALCMAVVAPVGQGQDGFPSIYKEPILSYCIGIGIPAVHLYGFRLYAEALIVEIVRRIVIIRIFVFIKALLLRLLLKTSRILFCLS